MVPGHLVEDSKDIYKVMDLALAKVAKKIQITDFYLTGYSLGGIQAAFVSKLDEQEKHFNFKKVLLINPPNNLYTSISILDKLLVDNIPGGIDNFDDWYANLIEGLSDVYEEMGYFDLSGDYIYKAYKRFPPREGFLRALIGLSFTMSSTDMIFASDRMRSGGYISPKNVRMDNTTSLFPYMIVGYRTGFVKYFHEYFFPYYQEIDSGLTEKELIADLSLESIEEYLKQSDKIGLLHNEDDIIMAPGEVYYLQVVFGDRAQIYPTGGHCGNMNHPNVVKFIMNFFAE